MRYQKGGGRTFNYFILFFVVIFSGACAASAVAAAKKPTTVAELALYKGADRQQILEEGARKEGKLTLYTTHTYYRPIVSAFQKKYPFITIVEDWRAEASGLLSRVFEENKAGRHVVDVMAVSQAAKIVLLEAGMLQPFHTPELSQIEEDAIVTAPAGGALSAGHYQNGLGVGYNKNLIKKEQLPKSYQELLDPKWKGKLGIVGSESGATWMGCLLALFGEEFVRKMAAQEFQVHMVSAQAMNDIIVSGEYPFSPTIPDSSAGRTIKAGAPVDWVPLEPVASILGQIVLPKTSQHPHAAMLYIDFDLTRQAGEIYKEGFYNSPRKDVAPSWRYKKFYGNESSAEVTKLHDLFGKLFIKKAK